MVLGLRKGEGYGRIAVNRQGNLQLSEETRLDDPESQHPPIAPDASEVPEAIQNILLDVVRSRCLADMQQRAMTCAERTQKVPSNALLGRLRLFFQQKSPAESLKKLRDPAKEQLTNYQIDMRDVGLLNLPTRMTLYDLFKKAWTEPESLTQELIESHVVELVEGSYADTRQTMIDKLVADYSAEMCTVLLDNLLTALRRKDR